MPSQSDKWRIWDRETEYGGILYQRAVGDLPEMESSKSTARQIQPLVLPGYRILDVGCGAGHYLRSLRREIDVPFDYTGVDATASYVQLARKAWGEAEGVHFKTADVFSLPFQDGEFDIVISCNLLLHLPSVKVPLRELVRVGKRVILVRTLVGERSFRIQEVYSPETHPRSFAGPADEEEFGVSGEPRSFHFYNIYSESYIRKLLSMISDVASFEITADDRYEPNALTQAAEQNRAPDATYMIGRWQVNGYILQPWCFVKVVKEADC